MVTPRFTTFNRTDSAEAVFDLLTLREMWIGFPGTVLIELQLSPKTGVIASGKMGPLCLAARALIPAEVIRESKLRTVIDLGSLKDDNDKSYLAFLNLPGIRRIGGIRALAAVAANGPIWFHNVGEAFDENWVKQAGAINGVEVRVSRMEGSPKEIMAWLAKGQLQPAEGRQRR